MGLKIYKIPPSYGHPPYQATVYTNLDLNLNFAPPAPQIWGEIGIFRGSKSPSIGGFRGLDKVKQKTQNLCVHSSLSRGQGGSSENRIISLIVTSYLLSRSQLFKTLILRD